MEGKDGDVTYAHLYQCNMGSHNICCIGQNLMHLSLPESQKTQLIIIIGFKQFYSIRSGADSGGGRGVGGQKWQNYNFLSTHVHALLPSPSCTLHDN